jgi:hypothetical protein
LKNVILPDRQDDVFRFNGSAIHDNAADAPGPKSGDTSPHSNKKLQVRNAKPAGRAWLSDFFIKSPARPIARAESAGISDL